MGCHYICLITGGLSVRSFCHDWCISSLQPCLSLVCFSIRYFTSLNCCLPVTLAQTRVAVLDRPATMAQTSENPLLSSKPSDSGITVSLHPLVLLTASDQITRHRVRGVTDPIAGILLGQQSGREITAEHAFSAGFDKDEKTGKLTFKQPWLQERVQQCKF